MRDDRRRWSGLQTIIFVVLSSLTLWLIIVYVLTVWFPYDTTGEGPWPENYR